MSKHKLNHTQLEELERENRWRKRGHGEESVPPEDFEEGLFDREEGGEDEQEG